LVKSNLVVASVILALAIGNALLLVFHFAGAHFLGFDTGFEAHVGARARRADTTLVVVDRGAEGEHLMVSTVGQDVLEFVLATSGWLTADSRDLVLLTIVVMMVSGLAVVVAGIWLAAESISVVARFRVVEQGIVAFVRTDLALSLEALPAVKDSVVCWVVEVAVVVQVAWWNVVDHRCGRWSVIVDKSDAITESLSEAQHS